MGSDAPDADRKGGRIGEVSEKRFETFGTSSISLALALVDIGND